ncbi:MULTISPECIES: PRC-barrel domain-containing protein [unclassified Devosia]|uniref:PRC-barrel domain-containing protein n=1 Tax=unclassified Devosia TaxID=196773 RepID=UPI0020BE352F|nr:MULTISPECIES: PRC-barrel domain-containing protein [unclassified Devosia]
MIRTLFATTALTAVLSMGAIAQDAVVVAPAEPTVGQKVDNALDAAGNAMQNAGDAVKDAAQDAGAAVDNAVDNAGAAANNAAANASAAANNAATDLAHATRQPIDLATGYVVLDGDAVVSKLIGAPVYSDTTDTAEEIGTVKDLVIGLDGSIQAVVLGVGGFLGIGEKNVAVDFTALDHAIAFDNTERWVMPTTAEALTSAPDFVWETDAVVAPATEVTPAPAM